MIVMGEKEVVAWCLVQNSNIVMKVKKEQQQQQQTVYVVCVYVCVEYLDLNQATSGKVHCKVCHQ